MLAAAVLTALLGCVHVQVDSKTVQGAACDAVACDVPDDAQQPATMAEVPVQSGGAAMNGLVYVARGPGPHPVAILLHGYPGNESNGDLAQALRRAGWDVLLFHYRGTWGSPGTFTFARTLEDAESAVAFARSAAFAEKFRADVTRTALIGHSMGGWIALETAAEHPEVRCAASLAGANRGALGAAAAGDAALRKRMADLFGGESGPVRMAPRYAPVDELVANARRFDLRQRATALAGRPVLLVAGARDVAVPPAQHHDPLVAAVADAGAPQVEAVVLDADHAFSSQRIALARTVVGWIDRTCR